MVITPQLVKELREKSGAGMLDCKKALVESNGDMDAAIEFLRKKGLKALASKAGRIAAEGIVVSHLNSNQKVGVLLELNCETDFVTKGDEFNNFANDLAELVAEKNIDSLETLLDTPFRKSKKVSDELNLLVAKIGEKMDVRRFVRIEAKDSEKLVYYVHLGSKIGVFVKLNNSSVDDRIAKDIAMHIAASHPQYLNRSDIPPEVIEKEKEIYREQLASSGKPPEIIEKILNGKAAKFAAEVCLNEQVFIKDPAGKKSVAHILKEIEPGLKILSFVRYQVGEGMEKRKDDFAEEVKKMAKS